MLVTNMSNPPWPHPEGIKVLTTLDIPREHMKSITPTVEHTVGLVLAAHRRLTKAADDYLGSREDHIAPRMISRSTYNVLGLGRIGYKVHTALYALGATFDRVGPDFLICCASKEGNEKPIIDAQTIEELPPTASIINTAYPEAVDEYAVVSALREDRLWCYATDVWPRKTAIHSRIIDLLRKEGKLIITPHIGGSTRDAREETELMLLDQAKAYLEGK